jgi:chaperonin GroES
MSELSPSPSVDGGGGRDDDALHATEYLLLRERDIHAVASPRIESGQTGLYL